MAQTKNKTDNDDELIIIDGTKEHLERDDDSPFNKNAISRGEAGKVGGEDGRGIDIEEPELVIDDINDGDDSQDEESEKSETKQEKEERSEGYSDVEDFEDNDSANSENKKEDSKSEPNVDEESEEGLTDEEIDVYANMIANKYFEGTRNLTISWSQFSDMLVAEMVTREKIDLNIEFAGSGQSIGELIDDVNKNIEVEIRKTDGTKPALVSILKGIAKKYGIKMSLMSRFILFMSMDLLQMGTIIFTLKRQNKKMMKNFILQTSKTRDRNKDLEEKLRKEQEKNADLIRNRKKQEKEKEKENKKNKNDIEDASVVSETEEKNEEIDDSVVLQESINENS